MRRLLSNIISGLFWNRSVRRRVRCMVRYPQIKDYVRFVRKYAKNSRQCKIKIKVGYGAKNLVIILNDKSVFKFPLLNDGRELAEREKRITDAFRDISPIKIPAMQIIQYKNVFVRKYEFACGKLLTDMPKDAVRANGKHIAQQLAKFLYVLAKSDPVEIRDLKPNPNDKPGYLYGWQHGDIWQNFMLDEKTFDITYFIDWELAEFGSLIPTLNLAAYRWDKFGYRDIIADVMAEYSKLYFKHRGTK